MCVQIKSSAPWTALQWPVWCQRKHWRITVVDECCYMCHLQLSHWLETVKSLHPLIPWSWLSLLIRKMLPAGTFSCVIPLFMCLNLTPGLKTAGAADVTVQMLGSLHWLDFTQVSRQESESKKDTFLPGGNPPLSRRQLKDLCHYVRLGGRGA